MAQLMYIIYVYNDYTVVNNIFLSSRHQLILWKSQGEPISMSNNNVIWYQ